MSDEQSEMREAVQAASKARQHLLNAAEHVRAGRRPPATTQEIALPLVNAVSYLVDAVVDLQAQVARLEKLAADGAEATLAVGAVVEDRERQ